MFDPAPRTTERIDGEFPRGGSRPLLVQIEGVGACVLKHQNSPQGTRLLTNEAIGHALCDLFGLDHPTCGIAHVSPTVLPPSGKYELAETDVLPGCVVEPGSHFYSKLLQPAGDLVADELTDLRVANADNFAGAIVLDLVLGNKDRSGGNPNVLVHRAAGHHRIAVIDWGMAFGSSSWSLGNLVDASFPPVDKRLYSGDFSPFLSALRNPGEEFRPWLDKAENIERREVEGAIAKIPNEWEVTAAERRALVEYIAHKLSHVGAYIDSRLSKDKWWE